MDADEFLERLNFACDAIIRKKDKPIKLKALVKLQDNKTIGLDIMEVGFDDKTATIFIEIY